MRNVMHARSLGLLMLLCVVGIALTTIVVAVMVAAQEPAPTPEEVHAEVEEAKEEAEAKRSPLTKDLPPAPAEEPRIDKAALEAEMQAAMGQYLPTSMCHADRSACDESRPGIQTEAEMEAHWEASGRPSKPMPEAQRAKICAATGRECN